MDGRQLLVNLKRFSGVGLFLLTVTYLKQRWYSSYLLNNKVFGLDGNGGNMLKIITDLNDYEIAKLKWQKRAMWHCNLQMKPGDPDSDITTRELEDRGITWKDKHMEYQKRPPHDKYL